MIELIWDFMKGTAAIVAFLTGCAALGLGALKLLDMWWMYLWP